MQALWSGAAAGSGLTRAALGLKLNACAAAVAGSGASDDTVVTVPTGVTTLRIGQAVGSTLFLGGHVRDLRIWPTRLTNDQIKALAA